MNASRRLRSLGFMGLGVQDRARTPFNAFQAQLHACGKTRNPTDGHRMSERHEL